MAQATRREALVLGTGAAAAMAMPGRALSQAPADTADLLAERLTSGGAGLLAVEVDGPQVKVTARGRSKGDATLQPDAVFAIGSITKTFTALLLADACVRKRVRLNDAVEDALGLRLRDSANEPLRWVDLATHRSGLPRLPENMAPANPADPYADYGEAQLRNFLRAFRATTTRDSRFAYSNLGFGVLGYALGRLEGAGYEQMLTERVLSPLALADAVLALSPGNDPARLPAGHDAHGQPVPHWHFGVMAPAGGLIMGAAALARYAQAALGVFEHPLQEAFSMCLQWRGSGPSPMNPTGLGWLLVPLAGRTGFNHDGQTFGFVSSLYLDPSRQRAAAMLSNGTVEVNDMAAHLLDRGIPLKKTTLMRQQAVAVEASQLVRLVGRYALNPQFAIEVTLRDDQLWAQATGQGAFQLFAAGPRRFFARVTPLEIEFQPLQESPQRLRLFQGGNVVDFARQD